MKVTYKTELGETRELQSYDDGMAGWDYRLFVFGNEFGPVALVRAEHEGTADDIWLDEFADIEEWDDIPPECRADIEKGEGCECHTFAPNGARSGSESDSPYRSRGPYEWMREVYDGKPALHCGAVSFHIEEDDDDE